MNSIITKSFAVGLAIFAVSSVAAQNIDAKSRQILDAVSANYKAKKNTYFKFIYGTGNGKITKNEPGIFYATPSQYRLKIMGTEQIFDGKKVYSVNDEDKEITIAKPNGAQAAFSPLSYLDSYKKNFNAAYQGKKTISGVAADLIKLTPAKANGLSYVYIFVNSAKNQLMKIEQHSENNDLAVIALQDYRENQNLDPGMFSFNRNKYKNYIVTEL